MDEPTTGLHPIDIAHFMTMLHTLVDAGNTFILIEHNLQVISQADYIVELGPDGGRAGGHLVFAGSFQDFLKTQTKTSQFLIPSL